MGANGTLTYDDIDQSILRQARFCFVTGTMVMKTFDGDQTARLLRDVQACGVKTLLDTVYADTASRDQWQAAIYPCLPHLDYFIPSQPEARAISGLDRPEEMARAFQDRGCRNVVIKLDEKGAYGREADGREHHMPSYAVASVVDTTGAGDSWCAGFLAGLHEGLSLPDASLLGNATAAHCIQAPGAQLESSRLNRSNHSRSALPCESNNRAAQAGLRSQNVPAVPVATEMANLLPCHSANRFSNSIPRGPVQ